MNGNGSFDGTYTPPAFDSAVRVLRVLNSGKVIVAGSFTGGAPRLARLVASGATDPAFDVGTGPNGPVFAAARDGSGALYAGGNFFSFNGSSSRPVIKLAAGIPAYELWVAANFTAPQIAAGDADPGADPDGDGFDNTAEWGFGTPPLADNPSPASISRNAGFLQLSLGGNGSGNGAWLGAQFSDDLDTWEPEPALPGGNSVYDIIANGSASFIIRDKTTSGSRRFVRLRALHPQ